MKTYTKKRVGILTIPRYLNYGTQLQAFALHRAVSALGYDAELLDYELEPAPAKSTGRRLFAVARRPSSLITGLKRRKLSKMTQPRLSAIERFRRSHQVMGSDVCHSTEDLSKAASKYDAVVVGSDQIWNPLGHIEEDAFFLPFVSERQRVAYAPSIGVSVVDSSAARWIADGVKGIRHLSVREDDGARIIKEVTGRTAQVVVDPTILLTPDEWSALVGDVMPGPPYLLCYFLQNDAYAREHAAKIARERNLRVVLLPFAERDLGDPSTRAQWRIDVDPFSFARLVRDAAFVCTDSFHGSVFSVLFRTDFNVFRRYHSDAAVFSRMQSFLRRIGLENRAVGRESEMHVGTSILFDQVHIRLSEWRAASIQFLTEALFEASTTRESHESPARI